MLRSILLAAALAAAASAAQAQTTLEQLKSRSSQLLGRLEVNLTLREAIEMQAQQLDSRVQHLHTQREVLNTETEQSNVYCRGEFEEAELQRRAAQCATWQGGLDMRQRDVDNEYDNVERQYSDLQRRDEERVREARQLAEDFAASVVESVGLCSQMSAQERAQACRPPPSAGPRTIELLNWAQAMFDSLETRCANLTLDRMVECERQPWDGSVYHPNRPELPDPY